MASARVVEIDKQGIKWAFRLGFAAKQPDDCPFARRTEHALWWRRGFYVRDLLNG